MSTVAHERCVCALGAPGLFFLSLAWDVLRSLGAGSVGARALALRVRSFSRDARLRSRVGRVGGARKDGAGVSRWWSSGCCSFRGCGWRTRPCRSIFLRVERWMDLWVPFVPVSTLTATIMELKVWTGFFWYRMAQGQRCTLAQVWVDY